MHSSQHGPWGLVYKVDYSVLGTLLSSLVLLNTRVVSWLKPFESWIITLAYAWCITLKQWCVPYTNTNTPAMVPTYGRVLSAIEKALWELVEKYWGVGTWWRARRGIQPNWTGLGLQWSRDGAQKKRVGERRTEVTRRGLRMALGKIRRRKLHRLPPVSILVLFFLIEFVISCELNMWVRKVRIKWKEVWKFWEGTPKSAWKLRVTENK